MGTLDRALKSPRVTDPVTRRGAHSVPGKTGCIRFRRVQRHRVRKLTSPEKVFAFNINIIAFNEEAI